MYLPSLETVRISYISWCTFFHITLVGVYMTGPLVGKVVDAKGPRPLLIAAFILLLSGYSGIRGLFDAGLGSAAELSKLRLVTLVMCSFLTGVGAHAGMASAMNTTAKTFPDHFVSPAGLLISYLSMTNTHPASHRRRSRHGRVWALCILLFFHLAYTLSRQYVGFFACTLTGYSNSHDPWIFLRAANPSHLTWDDLCRGWIFKRLSAIGCVRRPG